MGRFQTKYQCKRNEEEEEEEGEDDRDVDILHEDEKIYRERIMLGNQYCL